MSLDGIIAAGLEISLGALASIVALVVVVWTRHWFARLTLLAAFTAPLVSAGIHDFLIIWGTAVISLFLLRSVVEICRRIYVAAKRIDTGAASAHSQFSLAKLLLGTVFVALLFAELHYAPLDAEQIVGNVEIGVAWGLVAACAWLALYSPAGYGLRWLPMLAVVPAAGYALDRLEFPVTGPTQLTFGAMPSDYFLTTTLIQGWSLLAALYFARWLKRTRFSAKSGLRRQNVLPDPLSWPNRILQAMAAIVAISFLLVSLVPGASLYVFMSSTPQRSVVGHPVPNAYPTFVAAGRQLDLTEVSGNPQDATGDLLNRTMTKNQAILDAVHDAVRRESLVPLTYRPVDLEPVNFDAAALRQLCRTMLAEANAKQFDGQLAEAAKIELDCIRMAMLSERGGLVLHSLVGIAIAGVGVARLHEQVAALNGGQCREIAGVLQELRQRLDPIEVTIERDRLWCRVAFGWRGQSAILAQLLSRTPPGYEATITADQRRAALLELLIVELMIRAFQSEQSRLPETLDELVPLYLPSTPLDPYDGRTLRYRTDQDRPNEFVLYSIGQDGIDDGGQDVPMSQLFNDGSDLTLNSFSGMGAQADENTDADEDEPPVSE